MITNVKHYGRYRNIHFEINEPHQSYPWAYYIFLDIDKIQDKTLAENSWKTKGYMDCSDLHDRIELHYGCSYTQHRKIYGESKEYNYIVIGCDYGHLWDDGHSYTLDSIICDVMNSINSVHDNIGYQEK